ncbi:MAG TPA: amino acid permease [Cyanobacteria bacterium UBA9971]|nr:amino acid permease [Cyanobacteria bacterium UBA9971]
MTANEVIDREKEDNCITPAFIGKFTNVFRKKNPDSLINAANNNKLKRSLTAFDLTILGIGGVIGAGIFALSGTAAAGSATHIGAGPAVIVSLILAATACSLSALCYAEFAAMIPVAGSAYTYTYATLGEIAAWFIGWMLMLEYAIGNITVASSWSGYLMNFLKGFEGVLPHFVTNPPLWLIHQYSVAVEKYQEAGLNPAQHIPHLGPIPICMDLPAIFIIGVVTAFLYFGIKESTKMAFTMVLVKLVVICLFIGVGAFYVKPENWVPFAPNGIKGVFVGAYLLFFAYIGFDAVSTAAEETKNPQRDLPIGILASLTICTILYIAVGAVLTGMVPMHLINTHAPIAAAMASVNQNWIAGFISIGALAGLTSVLLVLQLGATRILYAMSRDKLLPGVFSKVHPKLHTPHLNTIILGGIIAVLTLFLDLNAAAELCNIGTFTAFLMVCVGILVLRKVDPDRHRPFRVPGAPVTPILGALICLGLIIFGLPTFKTLILFGIWITIGMTIYFTYGFKKVSKEHLTEEDTEILPLT